MSPAQFERPPKTDFDIGPSDRNIAFFEANGFLSVARITTDDELAWIRRLFEHIFAPPRADAPGAPINRSGTRHPAEAFLLSKTYFPEMAFPALLETAFWRNGRRYASALLGVPQTELSGWGHMIRKAPGGRATLWHQDEAYWEPELSFKALGCWLPLQAVTTEMGAMQFIPGSHRLGILPHVHDDDPADNILTVADADVRAAVPCPLPAGGATFHHARTLHYTAANTTSEVRLAFPVEFQQTPTRKAVPEVRPWIDSHRKAIGAEAARPRYMADGKLIYVD